MAAMASSFLPVNNGAPAPPTDPAIFVPKDPEPAALPTPKPEMQQQGESQSLDRGNIQGNTNSARRDNGSMSSGSSQTSFPPVETKQRNADGSVNSDGNSEGEHEHDGSENGADTASISGPPSKKKKGQRFFCTDFPPCNLSFTRSEHLARHIRKHTGERPFQCHCSRRFSRLDNLRQHAQTVHVNEEIPGDSLAASVTRVQRQIRTDRIRAPGRARAGTAGSATGAHARGHSRNLSASSVASMSSYGGPPDLRRRPPPLMMANDPGGRGKLTLDTMASPPRTPPGQIHGFSGQSPGSFFTPNSGSYSAVPGHESSPYYISPASSSSGYWGDNRGTPRRLSFPTGVRPDIPPHPSAYAPPYRRQPPPPPPPNASYGGEGPIFASPATATQPPDSNEVDWRRRTWHPSSPSFSRPATSGLWVSQTSDSQTAPGQPQRLPGIESFDRVQQRPSTPPRREPTPMMVDQQPTSTAPPTSVPSFGPSVVPSSRAPPPVSGGGHRRGNLSIDTTLQRTLTKLDLYGNPPPPSATSTQPPTSSATPNHDKRQSWADGRLQPPPMHVTGAEQPRLPSHVQAFNAAERRHSYVPPEYLSRPTQQASQPSVLPADTKPEHRPGMYSSPENQESGLGRLEALVAVATNERKNQYM